MKLLNDYFELQKQIYDYFGYVEDWVVIPLNDDTEYFWRISGDEASGTVCFAETKEELEEERDQYFENEIYTQRFLKKWVYRGDEFTMICVDTRTDGNKFLMVLDNSKEQPK